MTTKQHKDLARRLATKSINSYEIELILKVDLVSEEDKEQILKQVDLIRDNIWNDKVSELESELAKERKKSKDLQDRLNWLHSLNDCDEEFEL